MPKNGEVDDRILLIEQITLELLRKTGRFARRRILKRMRERFAYSRPLVELVRYVELELEQPNRDEITKYADFLTHRSNLARAYEEDKI